MSDPLLATSATDGLACGELPASASLAAHRGSVADDGERRAMPA
jgi:hypothetical protein